MELIDKSKIVAEIERRIQECDNLANAAADNNLSNTLQANELLIRQYKSLLYFLDTLETKEVDLEKETDKYISENFYGSETLGFFANRTKEEPNWKDIALCAKHFFELGLKTRKGE